MAGFLVPGYPAVHRSVERLEKVDNLLRTEETLYREETSRYLNTMAAAVKEQESLRVAAREELEVETIKMSLLRHRFQHQRDAIFKEIEAAVSSARDANTAEINELQLEMRNIMREMEIMEKTRKDLEEHNVLLLPKRDLRREEHNQLLIELNLQLADKANSLIQVKEMKETIQTVKQKITQTKTASKQLREVLIHERTKFEETSSVLEKEVTKMTKSIQDQNAMNEEEQRKLDEVSDELKEKEEKVKECTQVLQDHAAKEMSQLDGGAASLNTEVQELEAELEAKIKESAELDEEKALLEQEFEALNEELKQNQSSLQQSIAQVEAELEEGRQVESSRLQAFAEVSDLFSIQRKEEDKALVNHDKLLKSLKISKDKLEKRLGSIARYKMESKNMQMEMEQLHESKSMFEDQFQKRLKVLQTQLKQEKTNRSKLELQRDELAEALQAFKEQDLQSTKEIQEATEALKKTYSELQEEEETQLQEQTPMDALIEELSGELSGAQEEHRQMQTRYCEERQKIKAETESIAQAQLEDEEKLKLEEPMLVEIQVQLKTEQCCHRIHKERADGLQKKKSVLEIFIQEVQQQQTPALLQRKEDLKQELKTLRLNNVENLQSELEQLRITEKSVYENGLMLEEVQMENSRLHVCIEQMKEDICDAREQKSKNAQEVSWLKEEVQSFSRSLTQNWIKDDVAAEAWTEQGWKLLEEFRLLSLKLLERKHDVGRIGSRLERELRAMSALLEEQTATTDRPERLGKAFVQHPSASD